MASAVAPAVVPAVGGACTPPSCKSSSAFQLQVRMLDGGAFWVEAERTTTIRSIKQSIMAARGIDVIMQKLICGGRLLHDDFTLEDMRITEREFLVLVTAKPRPPSLVSTGAPLPSSYQAHLHGAAGGVGGELDGGDDGDELDGELDDEGDEGDDVDDEGEGEGEEEDDGALDSSRLGEGESSAAEVQRLVEMGFDAHEADQALRFCRNDTRRAIALLRSGRLTGADEAVRMLHDRLRSLPAFHALQQVVRVDPQIMVRAASRRAERSV